MTGKNKERERLTLKNDRYVLDYRESKLTDKQREVLAEIKEKYPLLGEAHAVKEGFYSIFDAPDKKTATEVWESWKAGVPTTLRGYFRPLIEDLDGWHGLALTVFDHPYTNAYTEALNRFAKDVNRMGRGYSFDILRARLLYNEIAKVEEIVMPRKRSPQTKPRSSAAKPTGTVGRFSTKNWTGTENIEAPTQTAVGEAPKRVWYGAHIPTLCDLLEQGYFD